MQLPLRGARRASLALALGLAGLATCASAASAAPGVVFVNGSDGAFVAYHDDTNGGAPHINVVRGGTVLAQADGFASSGGTFDGTTYPPSREADLSLPNRGTLAAGDQLQVVMDGTTQTFTYDGLPTINADACNGATTFTGAIAAGATKIEASGWMSGLGSANGNINGTVAQSGTTYKATLASPVKTGDFVYIDATTTQNGIDVISDTSAKAAATCPAPPAPAPAPKPVTKAALPLATQIVNGLQATLGTQATLLSKLDITTLAGHSAVNVPFTFLVPGTVSFTWTVSGAGTRSAVAAKAKKKAKTLKIASGKKTSKVAGTAKVKLKLSKAGKKLLRDSKKLRVTFTASFTPAGGGAAQTTHTKFTLKKHKKSKRH
jgi:hypothetical protein